MKLQNLKLQHNVLEKLGDFLDFIPDEKLLADGQLHIENVEIRVSQLGRGEDSFVVLSARVTPVHALNLLSILTLAMSANHCWRGTNGATFSFDPLSRELFLSQRLSAEMVLKMPAYDMGDLVLGLYESTQHWQAVIEQIEFEQRDDLTAKTAHALSFGMATAHFQ